MSVAFERNAIGFMGTRTAEAGSALLDRPRMLFLRMAGETEMYLCTARCECKVNCLEPLTLPPLVNACSAAGSCRSFMFALASTIGPVAT